VVDQRHRAVAVVFHRRVGVVDRLHDAAGKLRHGVQSAELRHAGFGRFAEHGARRLIAGGAAPAQDA